MKRSVLVLICLYFLSPGFAQQVQFTMPLRGISGKDYFICRYVDHDSSEHIRDTYCGTLTYDGHKGTDFLIRSFKTMDSGVYVHAVADGRVFDLKDDNYDRMKTLHNGAQPNCVGILHNNRISTTYLHLMRNSIMVKVGDSVKAGQSIGRVGSSGYSTSPHLHLEVADSNRNIIDPFMGNCSRQGTVSWISQPVYDTSVFLIEDGFIPYVPNTDSLQERYLVSDTFNMKKDTIVCYWTLAHGLRKGDKITAKWFSPGGSLWSSYSFTCTTNEAYSYLWPYINAPTFKGKWTAYILVNDKLLATRSFYMKRK